MNKQLLFVLCFLCCVFSKAQTRTVSGTITDANTGEILLGVNAINKKLAIGVVSNEYGFYSNVNPDVSHPRWSQAKERRLSGDTSGLAALFSPKIDTQFLNGYAELAAPMYADMDLKKHY